MLQQLKEEIKKEISTELMELLPPTFSYKNVDRTAMNKWIELKVNQIIDRTAQHILSQVNEGYKETNIKELVEKMKAEIQEHGDMHGENCACNMEDPDVCECEEMAFWGSVIEEWMGEVNKMWVLNLKNHRKHCTPEGNKSLTQIKRNLSDAQSAVNKLKE